MLRTNLLDVADLAIVFCLGTITSNEDVDTLRQAVAMKLAKVNVVLDLSELETFSPKALAMVVALWRRADQNGTRLAIFNPPLALYLELKAIRSLCRITILTDAEMLTLLREAKAFRIRPSAMAARHWGQRLSHDLRIASMNVPAELPGSYQQDGLSR